MIMEYLKQIQRLNTMLLAEMPEYQPQAQDFPQDTASQRRLLRSLMNVRPPMPLKREFLAIQDNLLSAEREAKGVVEGAALPPRQRLPADSRLERGYYPAEGGRDRRRRQCCSFGLFLSLPRLR